ncbi:DNA polymerase Y family protein [Acidocella sp. C78]|uniref:Y-family DNA polymerase n=1 Tax=Acidocella sp. C78 TaxID=1671486 RepID=UPI00191BBFAF|nr:DNA polymerase Y family protein [Acidocella sp. C78]
MLSIWLAAGLPASNPSDAPAERALDQLALRCQGFTPLVAPDPPDGLLLDITGCAHLFGGEARLCARIGAMLPGARIAIGGTAMAARALARHGITSDARLDTLPVTALGLEAPVARRLHRLGIRRIGALTRLSRSEIRAGFSEDLLLRLDRLHGRVAEPLHFLPPPAAWREAESHHEPLLTAEQLRAALARLVIRLCDRLEAAECGLTILQVRFRRVDARVVGETIGFAAPARDAPHICRLLAERLNRVDPGFGVEGLEIEGEVAALPAGQPELGGAFRPEHTQTFDLLATRARLSRLAPVASHVPERAMRRIPVTEPPPGWPPAGHPRPVRLFVRPERIEVIAPVPDDPPLLMRWRGASHRITRATGPERIAREWWRHESPEAAGRAEVEMLRDYYAIEDEAGQRFWVFRTGLHGGARPPRWFIHGVF